MGRQAWVAEDFRIVEPDLLTIGHHASICRWARRQACCVLRAHMLC